MVGGDAIFEGDIVLGTAEQVERNSEMIKAEVRGEVASGVIISGTQFRWPNCTIPYDIDPGMPDQNRVSDAIAHWQSNTRFAFVLRTAANPTQFPDWVTFRSGDGCSSSVGRRGGQQFVNLGSGCTTGNAIHEIGHVTGMWHEQSREDRDAFVTINWANIEPGFEHNFDQHITDGDDVGAYDYGSIMHYPRNAFGVGGAETITPVDPNAQIGQRTALSPGDIATAGTLCPKTTKELSSETIKEHIPETAKELHPETVKEVNPETAKEFTAETVKEVNPRRPRNSPWRRSRSSAPRRSRRSPPRPSRSSPWRPFIRRYGIGNTIYKIFSATHQVWRETRLVTADDLAHLDALRLAPVIFQEYIPAVADLRVIIVDGQLFAMAIDSRGTSYEVDFRVSLAEARTSAVVLPDNVAGLLSDMVKRYGLVYAAVDLRLTPEGEYVFLEINPAGEFLFAEAGTGLPITEAVAGWLAAPT